MIWKPKEKDLTLEEAVELARKELAPFWFGKSPQIAGVHSNGGYSVFPLTKEFSKEPWLIFVIDPTQYSGETAIRYAREWQKRYAEQNLNVLVILAATYRYLRNAELTQKYLDQIQAEFIVAIDVEQTLAPAFGVVVPPKLVLLHQNNKYVEYSGSDWIGIAELELQKFLRKTDPGLPLLSPFESKEKMTSDLFRIEFGLKPKLGTPFQFPEGIFKKPPEGTNEKSPPDKEGTLEGNFETSRSPGDLLHEEELFITGKWKRDAEKIITNDKNATITFYAAGKVVSIIAESLSRTTDHPHIIVEAGGLPVYEAMAGENMVMDEEGRSMVKVIKPGLYHVIVNAAPKLRTITLRFENSDLAPCAIYGIRIGD